MTLKELLAIPMGTHVWDQKTERTVTRVPGGWIYTAWDLHNDVVLDSGVFVPEPPIRHTTPAAKKDSFKALFPNDEVGA